MGEKETWDEAENVKSGKSSSSDRVAAQGGVAEGDLGMEAGGQPPAESAVVKSKSNITNNRSET